MSVTIKNVTKRVGVLLATVSWVVDAHDLKRMVRRHNGFTPSARCKRLNLPEELRQKLNLSMIIMRDLSVLAQIYDEMGTVDCIGG